MKTHYNQDSWQVLQEMNSNEQGLSEAQAEERLEKYGKNMLVEAKRKPPIVVFLEQFKDFLVIILIIAAIVSMISDEWESAVVIFAVLALNAVLGTVQHFNAEKSLEGLKSLTSPNAKVLRDGVKIEVPSYEIVPGDIVCLEAGDLVVADGRIINNSSLQVNESSLTGESENVDKSSETLGEAKVTLGDQKNMVFSGSFVTYGRADMVVTRTGMNTEIGKIADLMNQTQQKKTPLQISLDEFSKMLAVIIICISFVVFGLELFRETPIIDSLLFAVALAVAAIPEALSSIVTIVQAMGTQRMVKQNAIIKELKSVESLGAVSIICSDKTGTLTQNKMTAQQAFTCGEMLDCKSLDLSCQAHKILMKVAVLTNDSTITNGKPIGDPTEFALVDLAHCLGIEEISYRESSPRLNEIPFDSDRKLMSTVHNIDGQNLILTKGAVDVLLNRVDKILTKDGVCKISEEEKKAVLDANHYFSNNGLRVLCFAYKNTDSYQELELNDEQGYTFIGLISLIDPPREESAAAVQQAREAGIKTIMITGDHKITASAIAKKIGIMEDGDLALTGMELDEMPDEELSKVLKRVSVYARVSPEHKIRIVNMWQSKGRVVAMTGDGVNDAPALKKSDIGIAMGITGTEVSKDAAAMILTDDNFATIVKAVANGRNVYQNIKSSIKFLLSGNMAAILAVIYATIAGLPIPFTTVHLLFINLITDSLPAIAIGMERPTKNILKEKPRNPKESILTKDFLMRIAVEGSVIGLAVITAFYIGLQISTGMGMTMAFCTLSLARLFHGFNCRSKTPLFHLGITSNVYSIMAFFAGAILLCAVVFVPIMQGPFNVTPLGLTQIWQIVLLSFLPTFLIQLYKLFRETKGNNHSN